MFINTDPLNVELNITFCYRLGTKLYKDIQKGKEATKILKLQQDVVWELACTKITTKAKTGVLKFHQTTPYFMTSDSME